MGKMEIEFGPDGSMKVDADGYTGDACIKELEKLENELKKLGIKSDLQSQERKRQTMRSSSPVRSTRRV